MNDWTNEEEQYLINNYTKYQNKELAVLLNKTLGAVVGRKAKLGLKQKRYYTEKENKYIKNNYQFLSDEQMAKHLNRPIDSVSC